MLELPEVLTLTAQLKKEVIGLTVSNVFPPTKLNKFCWFNGDPNNYQEIIKGKTISDVKGFGLYVELCFQENKLCINDGLNVRLVDKLPKDYQLAICFTNGKALVFTVVMYGGIYLHDGLYDNEYYLKSKEAISPFTEEFRKRFYDTFSSSKQALSTKAFIATEQRFPGIGNGVSQDILFEAELNPKRKIATLNEQEKELLYESIIKVLKEMTELGGRDTEKDLYGNSGVYKTKMSKNGITLGCPRCKGEIKKEAFLGGSIYYCPNCQKV